MPCRLLTDGFESSLGAYRFQSIFPLNCITKATSAFVSSFAGYHACRLCSRRSWPWDDQTVIEWSSGSLNGEERDKKSQASSLDGHRLPQEVLRKPFHSRSRCPRRLQSGLANRGQLWNPCARATRNCASASVHVPGRESVLASFFWMNPSR